MPINDHLMTHDNEHNADVGVSIDPLQVEARSAASGVERWIDNAAQTKRDVGNALGTSSGAQTVLTEYSGALDAARSALHAIEQQQQYAFEAGGKTEASATSSLNTVRPAFAELQREVMKIEETLRRATHETDAGLDSVAEQMGETRKALETFSTAEAQKTEQQKQLLSSVTWEACEIYGPVKGGANKRSSMDATLLEKLENVCGRMKAEGYEARIEWGYRTEEEQVHILTGGRTFTQFKEKMESEVTKKHITKERAQHFVALYDPEGATKKAMKGGNIVAKTLDSAHREGKAADVVDLDKGWHPTAGDAYWDALKKAAEAEGLTVPISWDKAHVVLP